MGVGIGRGAIHDYSRSIIGGGGGGGVDTDPCLYPGSGGSYLPVFPFTEHGAVTGAGPDGDRGSGGVDTFVIPGEPFRFVVKLKVKLKMKLNVDLPQLDEIKDLIETINKQLEKIIMTGDEALAAIQGIGTQLTKAKDEIVAKIAELTAALANANISPAAEAALADLKAQAQALDDVVADVTPPAG
jgi:hypothetical protein